MKITAIITSLMTLAFSSTVLAEGVSLDPGQWEMTTTMTMSMMAEPKTTTELECITESELDPADFNMGDDSPCDINDLVVDDNTASWAISCSVMGGMEMEGQWEFTSNGDTIEGTGEMGGEMAGMRVDFKMEWSGKRVGDC